MIRIHNNVTNKIKIEDMTTEQRKRYAIIANKAERKRRLKALIRKKRMDLKKPIIKKNNKEIRIVVWSFIFFLIIYWSFFMNFIIFN